MKSSASSNKTVFSSAGFDLDQIKEQGGDADNIVLELGADGGLGTPTTLPSAPETLKDQNEILKDDNDNELSAAESFKQKGNDAFKQQNWELAWEYYTQAIDAMPEGTMTAPELLKLKEDWEIRQQQEIRRKMNQEDEKRRIARLKKKEAEATKDQTNANATQQQQEEEDDDDSEDKKGQPEPPAVFQAPPEKYADKLSVYYCNRAAVLLHLKRYEDAIRDSDVAILWNPLYTKAYIRRCTAYEQTEKMDLALEDAKIALRLDPHNKTIQQTVRRLQKMEDERLEKLKTETLDKLKDLGNSILGNFGLSLNNFKTQQDPKTGSYNISFQN